jgi:hypothetical protein
MLQSVLGILGSVRAQHHTHHVITVALGRILLDGVLRKPAYVVQVGAESAALASWEVPNEAEQEPRDVPPCRLEDEVQWGRIKRRVDAGSSSSSTRAGGH